MLTIKLSDKPCLFCGAKENTVVAKSKENGFQGTVCGKHVFELLKRWSKDEPSNKPE